MDAPELEQLRSAIMSGTTYSDVDLWRGNATTAIKMCTRLGVAYSTVGGGTAGPFTNPTTAGPIVLEQLTARWPVSGDNVNRTLAEAVGQVVECVRAVLATPTPPPPPPPVDNGSLLWAADMTKADSTAAGFQAGLIQRQYNGGSIQTSSTPVPIGTAPDGSRGMVLHLTAGMERLEVQPPVAQSVKAGDDLWLGFWFVGDANVERARDPWSIILQVHGNDTTSPHQIIAVDGGDLITGNGSTLKRFYNGRVKAGVRHNIVFHAPATAGGPVTVWVNGELVLDNYKAGLNATPGYVKTGLYRQPSGSPDQTIWSGGHRVGTSYGAVAG